MTLEDCNFQPDSKLVPFQMGYGDPLFNTMSVDNVLADVQAMQTLSRLNRAHVCLPVLCQAIVNGLQANE